MLTPRQKELLDLAEAAASHAYAPESGFRVGAALRAAGGDYTGCNIENASLSLSICAERVAVFKALSQGERDFQEMAVINDDGGDAAPCGACRQVLAEFAPGLMVTFKRDGELVTKSIEELLPERFRGKAGTGG